MALATRRKCHCRQPHGEPGSTCWKCEGRVGRSSGRDHHSSPVRRTYIEESHPGLGVISGKGFGACTGPRGYAKVESINGTDWAETMAWGGSSLGSYAYAGQNGMFGGAAPGGHAVAMCGSGSDFTAAIYEPGKQVSIRHSDGSKSRGRGKISDSKQGGIRYIDKDEGGIEYSGGNQRGIRYSDGNKRGMRYIDDEDEGAIRHSGGNQRAIEYSEKKQKAIMFGNENHRYYEQ